MISVIVLMLGFVFVIFEGENHKSEICVKFVILEGKIINMKIVFVICVYICVCVWDFGSKNDKSEICVFVICVFDFGTGMTGQGPRGPTGRVWGEKNNPFIKRVRVQVQIIFLILFYWPLQ